MIFHHRFRPEGSLLGAGTVHSESFPWGSDWRHVAVSVAADGEASAEVRFFLDGRELGSAEVRTVYPEEILPAIPPLSRLPPRLPRC